MSTRLVDLGKRRRLLNAEEVSLLLLPTSPTQIRRTHEYLPRSLGLRACLLRTPATVSAPCAHGSAFIFAARLPRSDAPALGPPSPPPPPPPPPSSSCYEFSPPWLYVCCVVGPRCSRLQWRHPPTYNILMHRGQLGGHRQTVGSGSCGFQE